jgi:alpha-tubulin suppressor-like RCC1 family protein
MVRGGVWPGRPAARSGRSRRAVVRRWAAAWAALALVTGACVAAQVAALLPASAALSHATTIAGGTNHTCAIRNGRAYCWGSNANGQLGNNSIISSSAPVAVYTGGVLAGKTLTQITAGTGFTCALDSTGTAYCWGSNANGQLGNNSTTSSSVPVAVTTSGVLAGKALTQIAVGQNFTCALDAAGTVYCWGANGSGQLGNGSSSQSLVPLAVTTSGVLAGVTLTQITAGAVYACALGSTGAAYCWGANGNGQLGNGTADVTFNPLPVVVTSSVILTQITAGANFTCGLASTGAAYCWGANGNGQLGNNSTTQSTVPTAVTTSGVLSGLTLSEINPGSNFTCALATTGAAYCWGGGLSGQLGNNSTLGSLVPVAVYTAGVLAGKTLTQISAGSNVNDACAQDSTGAAFCWGINASGQLGNPDTNLNFKVPVAVMAPAGSISAGWTHSCTLRNGRAFCWGDNTYGELGNNTTTSSSVPVAVTTSGVLAGQTLIQVSAGNGFACALDSTGTAYCWGHNADGELGNNTITSSSVPVAVTTSGVLAGQTLIQITAGNAFACALSAADAAYCWGRNPDGELGNNTTTSSRVPVAVTASGVLAGTVLSQISAGSSSVCALSSTGAAYCWGGNSSGQLGNNSVTQSNVPVAVTTSGVLSGKTLTQVTVGTSFACALDYTGTAYCWGHNGEGELGINSTTDSHVPAAVTTSGVLSGKTLTQVSAGGTASCALDSGGAAYCWGDNADGDLGNNSTTESNVPVTVTTSGVLSGKTLIQATAGSTFACALDTRGGTYCWGDNSTGQLGNGSTSNSSVPVIVQAVLPGAPTGVTATPGDTTATISWTAPSSFGSGTLTGYTATASPGSASCSTSGATTCTVTGLTNGTTYTVTVITHATGGDSSPSSPVTVTPTGMLAITVPSTATLPGPAPGSTASAQLGTVTVTDTRGLGTASWTVMVTATAFTTGSGTGPQTIPPSQVTYWSGPATATTGTGTFTPGQASAASAVTLSAARTAFSLTGGSGINSASWNATVSVSVPASAVAGTYTATITHSVA